MCVCVGDMYDAERGRVLVRVSIGVDMGGSFLSVVNLARHCTLKGKF